VTFAPSSFRDPDARVLAGDDDGRVVRALSARAAAVDADLRARGVLDELVRDGLLVASQPCTDVAVPAGWAAVVESPRLPFVSYPYEWSFGMLQDAALLTLRLTERLLAREAILKDASAYNVLFDGSAPLFIDVASLAAYEPDSPWVAYAQFCDQFLAPLMLEAYRGVPFQPALRGSLEGLSITEHLAPLLSAADLRRAGVLVHVKVRAMLDRRSERLPTGLRREVRRAAVPKAAVLRNLRGLQRVVAGLRSGARSVWAGYDEENTYDQASTARKSAFVAAACERLGGGRMAWDVGANTGRYSRILAARYACVVALDADAGAVDRLYRALAGTPQARTIVPLVADLLDPSPARGWRGRERAGLLERVRPELALYLALVHHLCLGHGVPLDDFVDFACATSPAAVIEFVAADDPMSQAILATKAVAHPGYDLAAFRALAAQRARIAAEESVSPTRHLMLLTR
jgi:hypothetical protein